LRKTYELNSPQIHAAAYKTSATLEEFEPRIKTCAFSRRTA
jgi:hypothetical protein